MSGLKRFLPELRWRLPRAKQYYSNWQGTHVTKQANPFPPGVIMAYTGLAVATRQYSLAALLLVSDFSFPPCRRACFTHCSKGCNRPRPRANLGGAAQDKDIPVENPFVAKLVSFVLQRGCQAFWTGTPASFRATLKQFASSFALDDFAFSAYSIRRGELLVRGRWQSQRTARIYTSILDVQR